jgi:NADH-quinone oxidoreductase subunit G
MEGFAGNPPPALIARFWAPGWNSVQSVNKFQKEVGGPLAGGDPGVRLFDVKGAEKPLYFQANFSSVKALGAGEVLVVPIHHVFGSEELSVRAPGIAGLCPAPYVAVNMDDAHARNLQDGQGIGISFPGIEFHLPVRIDESLPTGVAGLPAGVPGLSGIKLPACGYLFSGGNDKEKRT